MAVLIVDSAEQALTEVRRLAADVRILATSLLQAKDELERLERDQKKTKSALQNAQLDLLRLASIPERAPDVGDDDVDDHSSTESLELFADVDEDPRNLNSAPLSSTNAATGYRPDFGQFYPGKPL